MGVIVQWLPAIVIFVYLAIVLYIGIFAFRRGRETGEDFFLASRSIGGIVFFLSLFATNMTAFAILGSSGMAYKIGIGVFGMMATSSALVIPLTLFFIGTRLWALGKRFGYMTQVAFFRDRWECSLIGTLIFLVTASMLLPYLIISIDGGGTILSSLTDGKIPYAVGGAIVALIVMATVFFGGMRGAVWVNVLQTLLFISFGIIAFTYIDRHLNGHFEGAVKSMINNPSNTVAKTPQGKMVTLLTRERIPWQVFLSFMLIPLSSIMFPHMSIMCFTAKKVTAFKKTVVLYPLCIMAIWLPCVYLGALGPSQTEVRDRVAATSEPFRKWLEAGGEKLVGEEGPVNDLTPTLLAVAASKPVATPKPSVAPATAEAAVAVPARRKPAAGGPPKGPPPFALAAGVLLEVKNLKGTPVTEEQARSVAFHLYAIKNADLQSTWGKVASNNSDNVLLEMLKISVPKILFGLLAAGIISAVMGSDCHQILGLSTMFTKDIFTYYGGGKRLGEKSVVHMGRAFVIIINTVAYIIALGRPPIFDLAVTYAFSGFAALAPMMIAALFWKGSTKWGALLCTLWVGASVGFLIYAEGFHHYKAGDVLYHIGNINLLFMSSQGKLSFLGMAPPPGAPLVGFSTVVPMAFGSAILMVLGSLISPKPSAKTIEKYFPSKNAALAAA